MAIRIQYHSQKWEMPLCVSNNLFSIEPAMCKWRNAMAASNVFYVYGCYGTMTVKIGTGEVLHYEPENPKEAQYADISRIDINTYERTMGRRIMSGFQICIMDLQFWSQNGKYFILDPYKTRCDDSAIECSESVQIVQVT
jgi:hypothetical protein